MRYTCRTPTHLFYKLMDNRKTKTTSFFRPSFVTLIEPFKNVFQIFLLNSHSIIRQQQLHVIFLL